MNWQETKRQATEALRARGVGALDTTFGMGKTTEELNRMLQEATNAGNRVKAAFRHSGSGPQNFSGGGESGAPAMMY